jgi:hypothetical protein
MDPVTLTVLAVAALGGGVWSTLGYPGGRSLQRSVMGTQFGKWLFTEPKPRRARSTARRAPNGRRRAAPARRGHVQAGPLIRWAIPGPLRNATIPTGARKPAAKKSSPAKSTTRKVPLATGRTSAVSRTPNQNRPIPTGGTPRRGYSGWPASPGGRGPLINVVNDHSRVTTVTQNLTSTSPPPRKDIPMTIESPITPNAPESLPEWLSSADQHATGLAEVAEQLQVMAGGLDVFGDQGDALGVAGQHLGEFADVAAQLGQAAAIVSDAAEAADAAAANARAGIDPHLEAADAGGLDDSATVASMRE